MDTLEAVIIILVILMSNGIIGRLIILDERNICLILEFFSNISDYQIIFLPIFLLFFLIAHQQT